jgi:putative metalloprotease
MLKFTPLLLAILYAIAMYRVSAWRTKKELNERSTQLMDPKLAPVLDRLAAALEVPQIKVYLYEVDPVNGLASPEGKVYLTRGFYRKFQNGEVTAEELASVIAHELGHVALGHTRRRMIDFSGQNALRAALAMFLSRFLPGIGAWVANALTRLLAAKMSRSDEYEADEYASALMVKAGLGTGPQKAMFAKLETLTGARAGAMPAWLISHPKTAERIAAIEAHEAKWGVTD